MSKKILAAEAIVAEHLRTTDKVMFTTTQLCDVLDLTEIFDFVEHMCHRGYIVNSSLISYNEVEYVFFNYASVEKQKQKGSIDENKMNSWET